MDKNFTEIFDFTDKMNKENLDILKKSIIYKTIQKGAIITGEGDSCNGIPFILEGSMRLFRISESGREMTLYKINTGELCILAADMK